MSAKKYQTLEARRDADREHKRAWARANKEKLRAWREANPDKVRKHVRTRDRRRYAKNPRKVLALNAQRKARVRAQTPPWANLKTIRAFYEACPVGMTVDHIIPLRGRDVSGLHVLENLQYLPGPDNSRKGNRFEGE